MAQLYFFLEKLFRFWEEFHRHITKLSEFGAGCKWGEVFGLGASGSVLAVILAKSQILRSFWASS
jgi:hypothetical protein